MATWELLKLPPSAPAMPCSQVLTETRDSLKGLAPSHPPLTMLKTRILKMTKDYQKPTRWKDAFLWTQWVSYLSSLTNRRTSKVATATQLELSGFLSTKCSQTPPVTNAPICPQRTKLLLECHSPGELSAIGGWRFILDRCYSGRIKQDCSPTGINHGSENRFTFPPCNISARALTQ